MITTTNEVPSGALCECLAGMAALDAVGAVEAAFASRCRLEPDKRHRRVWRRAATLLGQARRQYAALGGVDGPGEAAGGGE